MYHCVRNWPLRAIAMAAGGALLWPGGWPVHLAGLALFGLLLGWNLIDKRRASAVA